MHIVVVGAGIIGTTSAWYLAERGHQVTVIERQIDAALETSFGNAGQISVSHCEPWANRQAPLKALRWMFSKEAPLLFRPQWPLGAGWQQYRWTLQFLAQCNDADFHRNVGHIVALGKYSHSAFKALVAETGIAYHRLERGIAHIFSDQAALDSAAALAQLMQQFGVQREVIDTAQLLRLEPSLAGYGQRIVGATFTASDETGDARVFTQALARACAARGVEFLFGQSVQALVHQGGQVQGLRHAPVHSAGAQTPTPAATLLRADAVVLGDLILFAAYTSNGQPLLAALENTLAAPAAAAAAGTALMANMPALPDLSGLTAAFAAAAAAPPFGVPTLPAPPDLSGLATALVAAGAVPPVGLPTPDQIAAALALPALGGLALPLLPDLPQLPRPEDVVGGVVGGAVAIGVTGLILGAIFQPPSLTRMLGLPF
jgi:hypothetical protein